MNKTYQAGLRLIDINLRSEFNIVIVMVYYASITMSCWCNIQESDLQHLVNESYLIENQYGHYFDWIIVNDDFHVAADMLKEVSRRLEVELQWVPYAWKNY